jgi:hypothetical protein
MTADAKALGITRLCQIGVLVHNLERATAFYRDVPTSSARASYRSSIAGASASDSTDAKTRNSSIPVQSSISRSLIFRPRASACSMPVSPSLSHPKSSRSCPDHDLRISCFPRLRRQRHVTPERSPTQNETLRQRGASQHEESL